jgi:hypothetical protein
VAAVIHTSPADGNKADTATSPIKTVEFGPRTLDGFAVSVVNGSGQHGAGQNAEKDDPAFPLGSHLDATVAERVERFGGLAVSNDLVR